MRNLISFLKELFRNPASKWLLSLYGLFGFITTVIDQFFPAYSERLRMLYLLPKWHWRTWVIIGLGLAVVVLFFGAYSIWEAKEKITATNATPSPRVVLDFESHYGDVPTKRNRVLIVRNVGTAAAFNIRMNHFTVGDLYCGLRSGESVTGAKPESALLP